MKNIQLPQITKDRLLELKVGESGNIIIPISEEIEVIINNNTDKEYGDCLRYKDKSDGHISIRSYDEFFKKWSLLQQGDKFYIGEEFAIYKNPFGSQSIISYGTWKSNLYIGDKSEVQSANQMQPHQSRFQGECLNVEVVKMQDIQPRNILINYHRIFAEHNKLHNTTVTPSMDDYVFLLEVRRDK